MKLAERGEKASYLIKDGDTKFTAKFDEIFKSEGIKVKKLPFRSPNLNAYAERSLGGEPFHRR
jgi:putative transposase